VSEHRIRIGTRGSPMALYQAGLVRDRLIAAHPDLERAVEVVAIRTEGDRVQDRRLAEIGGKGLFTREIEDRLCDGRLDLAVHSLKDLETWLPEGLVLACVPPRDDPRDALLAPGVADLAALPPGAKVGTAALRRQAQLLRLRPDLVVVPFRGNADTRIRKLDRGEVDATLLAVAGLARLGLACRATQILPTDIMLPAVGQGALAIECRADDDALRARLAALNDPVSAACVAAERAMLAALDGSCRTPIAGLAEPGGGGLVLRGLLLRPDGTAAIDGRRAGSVADAAALGADLGAELRRRGGPEFGFD